VLTDEEIIFRAKSFLRKKGKQAIAAYEDHSQQDDLGFLIKNLRP